MYLPRRIFSPEFNKCGEHLTVATTHSYLIGYDLKKKGEGAYENLFAAIRGLGEWWHDLDSTWFVLSGLTHEQICNQLVKHIGQGDKLLVLRAKLPGSCEGLDKTSIDSLSALLSKDTRD